jgi:hypothetical protein
MVSRLFFGVSSGNKDAQWKTMVRSISAPSRSINQQYQLLHPFLRIPLSSMLHCIASSYSCEETAPCAMRACLLVKDYGTILHANHKLSTQFYADEQSRTLVSLQRSIYAFTVQTRELRKSFMWWRYEKFMTHVGHTGTPCPPARVL